MPHDLLDRYPIRQELLEHVSEREVSYLPIRTFKVISHIDPAEAAKIIVSARTHLGAAIALYDYSTIPNLFSGDPWSFINGLALEDGYRSHDFTDIKVKEAIVIEASSIGGDDTYLVEIDENDLVETDDLVNLSLFP